MHPPRYKYVDRIAEEAHFLYTAFCPLVRPGEAAAEANDVLVKVGITVRPWARLVEVHCGNAFGVDLAAFAPAGSQILARKMEREILKKFRDRKTRGEWLWIPNTAGAKKEFAAATRETYWRITGRPVKWRRVSRKQLMEYMGGQQGVEKAA